MGNQNTSGILAEEKAIDNAPEHVIQENAVEEVADDKSPPREGLVCHDKVIEDQMEGCDGVLDMSTNGSDSMLGHEEQEQACTLKAADATLEVDFNEEEKEEDGLSLAVEGASSNTTNDAPRIGLLDSSTEQSEHENEFFNLDHQEKPMQHELGHSHQEIGTTDPMDKIESESKGEDNLDDAEEQEDDKPINQDHETQSETTEKCVVEMQSPQEIDIQTLPGPKNFSEIESKSIPSHVGVAKVELRKSPSFDFGLSFETRLEDSDQTPLLYLDKPPRRSLSSCSSLKFQHKIVHTEYAKKPLQLEDEAIAQVEEKTIQMERSNSQAINTIQENPIKASPSREDEAEKSPKGRRKPRSSLFTTCLCCTAAIS